VTDTTARAEAASTDYAQFSHRQILTIFAGLMLGMLLAALDQTIVATALPTITGELGGLDHLSWVVTAYLLAATVSTPLYGKLGDLFGRKRLFQIAIATFLAGSVLCGMAQTMGQLIAFRALQGIGGGGLIVLAMAIIAEVVSPRERGRYQGYFGALFGATSVAGPLLGGFFTDTLSWRWVFYINLPLGLLALVVTAAVLPAGRRHGNPTVDYAGAAILTAAITCLVLCTTWAGTQYAWGSPTIIGLLVTAAVLLVALIGVERRAPEPIVPVHLFRSSTFNVSVSVSFIIGVAMFGSIAFLPLFLQVVNGASATSSGLLLMPLMLGLIGSSTLCGQIISRTGRYKPYPIIGCALATVSVGLLATIGTETSKGTVSAYMVALGIAIGMAMPVLILATQNSVAISDLGVATSSVSFFRSLGGSLGVALFGSVFNNVLAGRLGASFVVGDGGVTPDGIRALGDADRLVYVGAFAHAISTVFVYALPLVAVGFLLTWLLRETPLRQTAHGAAVDPDGELTAAAAAAGAPDAVPAFH
jgi:EmrB/QacA subfamily drug resistance transporter